MDNQSPFITFLQQPSDLAELQAGKQAFGRKEVQQFLASMQEMRSTAEQDRALSDLASLLPRVDRFHAGMLALLCGILVESGGNASIPLDATVELLVSQLTRIKEYRDAGKKLDAAEKFQRFPDAARAQAAQPFLLPAVMTMLSRDKEARKRWQSREDVVALVEEMEERDEVPFFLKRVFTLLDDKELLILDKQNKRGFLTRLVGVQDVMYHCFALLQHAILEYTGPGYLDAEPTDPLAVRFAQNRDLTEEDYQAARNLLDHQRFGFSYPGGLFFPGSANFSEVPVFKGMPVLLMNKKEIHFQWGPANMYPVLHEDLKARVDIVRELTAEELEDGWLLLPG